MERDRTATVLPPPALAGLLAWEAIVPLTGLSSFVLPRPSQILARMMSEYRLWGCRPRWPSPTRGSSSARSTRCWWRASPADYYTNALLD
jgi:hypothetical protein